MIYENIINKFSSLRVLVVGDIMLDSFMYGDVKRISPEAPVPVFNYKRSKDMLGGAGNVVANLCALGVKTTFIGVVGADENGRKISSLLRNCGAISHLLKLKNYPTIVKKRIIAGNTHLIRIDTEEKLPIPEEIIPRIKKSVKSAVSSADIVLLSDYSKGLLTNDTTQILIQECNLQNKKVLIDPKGTDYSKYADASLVKPNLKEFSEACDLSISSADPQLPELLVKGAKKIFSKTKIKSLLITLSEKGMAFVDSEDPDGIFMIPTEAKEVFDVSGAGDTCLATLGATIGCGYEIRKAMKLANKAAGIVVGKLGTACITAPELFENKKETVSVDSKIISESNLPELITTLRRQGKRIGFTNGCFDLLHLGHLSSLRQAKSNCDVLFVGINSDKSIKKLKGNSRPVNDENTRLQLLAAIEYVDYVILFNDDTAERLVTLIKPDVLAKEGYKKGNWPEADLVKKYGGNVITLKRIEGKSTSETIDKILNGSK